MFLALSLLAAVVLLVLDINNTVHLSYWWIGFVAAFPLILSAALLVLAGILYALAALVGVAEKAKKAAK